MKSVTRLSCALAILTLAQGMCSSPAQAGRYHKGTFFTSGGFNNPVGGDNQYFNTSGSFSFGGGRNVSEKFALEVEYTHNWLAIDPVVLDKAAADTSQISDAHASLWSVTLNGVYRFHPESDVVPWLKFGGGYYKRTLQLTQTALFYYPPIWDPWWWWIDGGWGPGEAIVGQRDNAGFGLTVGAGIDFEIDSGASLFLESRYEHAFLDGVEMQVVPIMAGVRW
jgi:opacity protein-like surface antigen